jgi:hypothetical protein
MRSFTNAVCRYAVLLSLFTSVAQARVVAAPNSPDRPIDEYGNLCWDDERARIDGLAVALANDPTATGVIVFYDGNPPCYEAALARAMQVKKYIVEYRGIAWNRVMWRYAGHMTGMIIRLDITYPGVQRYVPPPSISDAEAKPKNCKAAIYRRPKCRPYLAGPPRRFAAGRARFS